MTTAPGRPAAIEPTEDGYGAGLIFFIGAIWIQAIATGRSITTDDLVRMGLIAPDYTVICDEPLKAIADIEPPTSTSDRTRSVKKDRCWCGFSSV